MWWYKHLTFFETSIGRRISHSLWDKNKKAVISPFIRKVQEICLIYIRTWILMFISTRNKAGPERLETQLRVQTLSFHVKTKDSSDCVQFALKVFGCKRAWCSNSSNGGLFYWMPWRQVLFMTADSGHCYTTMLIVRVYGSVTSFLCPPTMWNQIF